MSQRYQKLKNLLLELFQLDQPDLDFGLYRIMHAKSAEVTQFLDKDLLPQVKEAFSLYQSADKAEIEKELAKAVEQANALGVDPETTQKVKDLRARLAGEAVDVNALEAEVYDHLYSFFRRYYSEGDFLSKRVYKPGVYAIPYEGEEVKLHWANADQYYIKTSEYLRDYAFRLRPEDEKTPMRVHFRLVDAAEGEHGNVKANNGKDRVFKLGETDAVAIEDGELVVRFTYAPDPEKRKQKDLNAAAEAAILAVKDAGLANWLKALAAKHVRTDGTESDSTRLRVHLDRYTARNTFDYFIHKDLGGFLRRELDFYIKNEVMHLDDVENETAPRVEQYLSKIKVIRRVAGKIIVFLAQLENFQKKLWLKKKFVVETSYCIRLGVIPQEFYAEIAANDGQWAEWESLHHLSELKQGDGLFAKSLKLNSAEFLKANPSLMVDTRHFEPDFTARLLEALGDLSEQTDGVLVHSENFQALSLMHAPYRDAVDCVYIDPPYNTDASAIDYKNDYKHSSWMSLIQNRLEVAYGLMRASGILCMAIDDEEFSEARQVLGELFPKVIGIAAVRSNPQSRKAKGTFSPSHEYALFYGRSQNATPGTLELTAKRLARYPKEDSRGRYSWMSFIRTGTNDKRSDRPKLFYPIVVRANGSIRVPRMEWSPHRGEFGEYVVLDELQADEVAVYPVVADGDGVIEKRWHRGHERVSEEPEEYRVRRDSDGCISIDFKTRIDEGATPMSWWDKSEYASANYGAVELKELFGVKPFDFPKAVSLVVDCLRAGGTSVGSTVVDYFGGSGTSGHSVINLNREDGGQRKFILVEQANYFDTVLLPRLKKVTFTPEWKDGKPKRLATAEESERGPRVMKVIRLESYEDALNNLETRRSDMQEKLLFAAEAQGSDKLKEQYMLHYLLEVETRGSQSLLNIAAFTDPTAYKLKVKRPGSDESREVNVDLLETFNWLIGLTVKHIAALQTFSAEFERDGEGRLRVKGRLKQVADGPWWFRTVEGTTPDGRKTLVIWRKLTGEPEQDNLVLDEWFTKQGYSSKDSEFDLIYVNGGNNLENLKTPDDLWKVRLIEDDFHRLMFATENV